jgi:hypothetical protein
MPLFLQLNLDALPQPYKGRFGSGLLQLFYCACESRESVDAPGPRASDHAFEAFHHDSKRVRVISSDPAAGAAASPRDDGLNAPAREIAGWRAHEEGPHVDDAALAGLTWEMAVRWGDTYGYRTQTWGSGTGSLDAAKLAALVGLPVVRRLAPSCSTSRYRVASLGLDTGWVDPAATQTDLFEKAFNPRPGDKLGGWPRWIQFPERPSCALCGAAMDCLFQVDSEDNVPYMFGDMGCGHITQCPTHRDVVTFGWACS